MSDTTPTDVDRALAAFGATPIKYRSFGKHQLRPAAAYVPAPAMVDDTVYDPFAPQPVVHSVDESRTGMLLPAYQAVRLEPTMAPIVETPEQLATEYIAEHVPSASMAHEEPAREEEPDHAAYYQADEIRDYHVVAAPEPASFASDVRGYEAPRAERAVARAPEVVVFEEAAPPRAVVQTSVQAGHGVREYVVEEVQVETARIEEVRPQPAELPPPPPATYVPPPVELLAEAEPEPKLNPDLLYPAPPGGQRRMRTAMPLPFAAPSPMPAAMPAPATASSPASIPAAAPQPPRSPAAEEPAPSRVQARSAGSLPTLGSQITARENARASSDMSDEMEPRSIAEMFRLLNGRPDPVHRESTPPQRDGISLFRRL